MYAYLHTLCLIYISSISKKIFLSIRLLYNLSDVNVFDFIQRDIFCPSKPIFGSKKGLIRIKYIVFGRKFDDNIRYGSYFIEYYRTLDDFLYQNSFLQI